MTLLAVFDDSRVTLSANIEPLPKKASTSDPAAESLEFGFSTLCEKNGEAATNFVGTITKMINKKNMFFYISISK